MARAFSSGALEAWIADEIGEAAAARAYLRYAQVRQIGAIVGTSIGVALGSHALWLPVLVGGARMLCLATALSLVMPERGFSRQHHAEINPMRGALSTFGRGLREVRARPLLGVLLALGFVLAFSTEGLDRLWEAHILRYFTLPTIGGLDSVVWFGAINIAVLLLSVGANQVVRRAIDVTDDRAVALTLIATSAVRIAGIVVFGLATSFELAAAGYLVHMVFRSISGPLFTGWINRHVDRSVRATVLSMGGQIEAVGQLTGGPLIGAIAELSSLRAAMVAVGATLLPAPALLLRALRQPRRG
jgi:DHA3 family tetracycline resistance protein-like MFS transporter